MNAETPQPSAAKPRTLSEEERLIARGFDGLYHPDPSIPCGCFIGDLRPCGETRTGCRGGHESADGAGIYPPQRKSRKS